MEISETISRMKDEMLTESVVTFLLSRLRRARPTKGRTSLSLSVGGKRSGIRIKERCKLIKSLNLIAV